MQNLLWMGVRCLGREVDIAMNPAKQNNNKYEPQQTIPGLSELLLMVGSDNESADVKCDSTTKLSKRNLSSDEETAPDTSTTRKAKNPRQSTGATWARRCLPDAIAADLSNGCKCGKECVFKYLTVQKCLMCRDANSKLASWELRRNTLARLIGFQKINPVRFQNAMDMRYL